MENKAIAKLFKLCSQLMELYDENPFRIKAMASASFKIEKLDFRAADASFQQLSEQQGIGKNTAEKIIQIVETGSFPELETLIQQTPNGVVEMMQIKGLGPKKIKIIWKTLEIESVGDLYYACIENRLMETKGFGLKTQEGIKKAIEFLNANAGWFLYARAIEPAEEFLQLLERLFPDDQTAFSGDYRRKSQTLNKIELVTTIPLVDIKTRIPEYQIIQSSEFLLTVQNEIGFTFYIHYTDKEHFASKLFETTGNPAHLAEIQLDKTQLYDSEEAIYSASHLPFIAPELREGLQEIDWAKQGKLPVLIQFKDLKGALHNHSTYSDGANTLQEMALYCKEELQLEYFGISDHSKSAFYANGLTEDRLEKQWNEVDQLNKKLGPFRILKGIESDILSTGELDYPDEILAKFDFIVASVHSNLKMDEEKATQRIIKAIENPYTKMLGHPTGRLLLNRPGYPINHQKIIDACAANHVVIEINANPLRLDLDWTWHQYAVEKGVLLSINPDAHKKEALWDMRYGVFSAQKGGLTAKDLLNSKSLKELEEYWNLSPLV